MYILGGICLVIAIVCFVMATRAAGRASTMQAIPTRTVDEATSLLREVGEDLGGGGTGYAELAEFKGKVVCESPVTGELSKESAAMIRTRITRDVETRETYRDSKGNRRTRWKKSSQTIHSSDLEAPFDLEDETGRVRIIPRDARLDLVTAIDRYEQGDPNQNQSQSEVTLSFAGFSFAASGYGGDGRRTLGYHYSEEILPLGHTLYVLGELADTADGIVVRKPTEDRSKTPYIVSTKSESELVEAAKGESTKFKIAAAVLSAVGVGVILFRLLG